MRSSTPSTPRPWDTSGSRRCTCLSTDATDLHVRPPPCWGSPCAGRSSEGLREPSQPPRRPSRAPPRPPPSSRGVKFVRYGLSATWQPTPWSAITRVARAARTAFRVERSEAVLIDTQSSGLARYHQSPTSEVKGQPCYDAPFLDKVARTTSERRRRCRAPRRRSSPATQTDTSRMTPRGSSSAGFKT